MRLKQMWYRLFPMPLDRLMTMPRFKAWVQSRDPSEKYNYGNAEDCAIMRFAREHGYRGKWSALMMTSHASHELNDLAREASQRIIRIGDTTSGSYGTYYTVGTMGGLADLMAARGK